MTTLGAKPNHAFFHCQHPAQKKTCGAPSSALRSRRESHHACLRRLHARSTPAFAGSKRNVVFKVVLFARLHARDGRVPPRAALRAMRRRHPQKDKRIVSEIFPDSRFFALHKPDCADLRELQKAIRAIRDASRAHRISVDDTRKDAFERIEAGFDRRAFRSRRRFEAPISVVARDDVAPRGQRKSRPRSRGRLRQSLRSHPRRHGHDGHNGEISGRLLPAAQRNRPERADR